jgi:protein-disulfide isomerase
VPSTATTSAPTATPAGPPSRWSEARSRFGTALRLLLAGVWLYAGLSKIGDPPAAVRAVRAYRVLPEWLAKGVGYGLPFVEIMLALLLLIGLATRFAAVLSAVLLAVFLAGIAAAAARGLRIECGCFGGGGDLASGGATHYTGEILRDVGLLVAALLVALWPRTRFALDDAIRDSVPGAEAVRVGPRRTKAAQERLAQLMAQRRREGDRRVLLLSSSASALLIIAVALAGVGVQSGRVGHSAGPTPQAVTLADGVVVGKASAKVAVDLYEDFQCPVCKQFEQSAAPVLKQYVDSGRVKARYHAVAFLNRVSSTLYSSRSANAGYCAADAGVFERFHDLLYANQPPEGGAGLGDDQLIAFGRQAGATGDAFAQCVRTRKYNDFVNDITETASRNGISGTPTVLVDGTQVQGLDAASLRTAIEAALGA